MEKKLTHRPVQLIPFTVIKDASNGKVDAINAVLNHYDGYIKTLSMRWLYDEYGRPHKCVDEALRLRLEAKLIAAILNFKIR